jgi:ATP-dependent Lhr-like helicase
MPVFLDETAQRFLAEARDGYKRMDLSRQIFLDQGAEVMLLTWLGDAANEAIACLLIRRGFTATPSGPSVEVRKEAHTVDDVLDALIDAAQEEPSHLDLLLEDVLNLQREKWDWALPNGLLRKAYASHYLDLGQALAWAKNLQKIDGGSTT